MSRLLLLACSERKRLDPGLMHAIERYDGPAYRVLRRYIDVSLQSVPDVYILSAQYGLIRSDKPIPMYDFRMTSERAKELRDATAAKLQQLDPNMSYQSVFIHAGAVYREVLSSSVLRAIPAERVVMPRGSQGVKLSRLKRWLYQGDNISSTSNIAICENTLPTQFKLRGRDFEIAPSEAIAVARCALENGMLKRLRTTAWYVLVDGQRIPPKWLVSQITGLPVAEFHSIEARRVLHQLGLLVQS